MTTEWFHGILSRLKIGMLIGVKENSHVFILLMIKKDHGGKLNSVPRLQLQKFKF